MKPSKFSEEQIIAILKEVELGAKVTEVCVPHEYAKVVLPGKKLYKRNFSLTSLTTGCGQTPC